MRITPEKKYENLPCSFVGTGCAYEDYYGERFTEPLPEGLKGGWLSLENLNSYIRKVLPITKKEYYKRGTRPKLKDFLKENYRPCLICVYGHFLYAKNEDYWSFFDNEEDDIVCIWYINK